MKAVSDDISLESLMQSQRLHHQVLPETGAGDVSNLLRLGTNEPGEDLFWIGVVSRRPRRTQRSSVLSRFPGRGQRHPGDRMGVGGLAVGISLFDIEIGLAR